MDFKLQGKATTTQAIQIVYHCIFGTFKEDLSVLKEITNESTWQTREKMAKVFVNRYYSQVSADYQNRVSATSYQQICCSPVFSGRRIQHYNDDFFARLGRTARETGMGCIIINRTVYLANILHELKEMSLNNGKRIEIGVTKWIRVEGMTASGGVEDPKLSLNATGEFFMGGVHF